MAAVNAESECAALHETSARAQEAQKAAEQAVAEVNTRLATVEQQAAQTQCEAQQTQQQQEARIADLQKLVQQVRLFCSRAWSKLLWASNLLESLLA